MELIGFGLALLPMLLFFIIGIGGTILWVWMLIDCITKESSRGNEKIVWLLVIFFLNSIGALLYFFIRRPQRIAELGR